MSNPNYVSPPLPKIDLELNWEKPLLYRKFKCFNCKRRAIMEISIDDNISKATRQGVYCKEHYETIFEDLLAEMSEVPDYDFGHDED